MRPVRDVVADLREWWRIVPAPHIIGITCNEAADLIERLQRDYEELLDEYTRASGA